MKNSDMPAMPMTQEPFPVGAVNTHYGQLMSGLTKREHFAAMAMQGLVVRDNFCDEMDVVSKMAVWSVACADALLAELEK